MNVFWFAFGALFGAFLVWAFNPKDITITGKNRAKKGGVIDFGVALEKPKLRKKLFSKFKNRRNKT